ncbi:MAG: class II fructose-bisphosphate aldolase, partial [Lacunisphaera sp.]|nr:class II fructose-bisphosphate aldolase [Lacunisphaera sp.]
MLLSPAQTRALIADALRHRYAVLAVNADSPAAVYDVLDAARQCDAPVIIETSLWQLQGRSFGGGDARLGLARYHAELRVLANHPSFRHVPVVLHTDHIKGPETNAILEAALPIYSSLSLDSSEMTPEENIAAIGQLCDRTVQLGLPLTLEMEAGVDAGVSPLSDCDALFGVAEKNHPGYLAWWAPGVGTQHGLGSDGYPTFNPEAVAAHQQRATKLAGRPIGLALHGSSGLPVASLQAAVHAGVAKVNWSSESLLIRSQAAQEYYTTHVAQLDKKHRDWKNTAMDNGLQT